MAIVILEKSRQADRANICFDANASQAYLNHDDSVYLDCAAYGGGVVFRIIGPA
jgi:hypothetical protein